MTSKEALRRICTECEMEMAKRYVRCPFRSIDNEYCEKYEKIKQDLELLKKYKKAIKIINDALELYIDFYEVGVEKRSSFIEYEDSELLREVLKEVE